MCDDWMTKNQHVFDLGDDARVMNNWSIVKFYLDFILIGSNGAIDI